MSAYNRSNGSMKLAYSISLGGIANCKPLDKVDSSCLVSLHLEELKTTVNINNTHDQHCKYFF